jgi:hypothetical protein
MSQSYESRIEFIPEVMNRKIPHRESPTIAVSFGGLF